MDIVPDHNLTVAVPSDPKDNVGTRYNLRSPLRLLQDYICDPTCKTNTKQRKCKRYTKATKKEREFSSFFPFFFCRSPNVDIFTGFLAFDEKLNEVDQALDDVVAHLLPPPPDKVLSQQGLAQAPLPLLLYNSESELDSDNEIDLDLPWREVQDIPSFQLMNLMRNPPQQPTENSNFSLQNDTPPLNNSDNHDRDGLQGD